MSPLLLRLLAFAAAIAMVVGALAVRNRMDDDEVARSTELRLRCTPELEEVCRALEADPDSSITVSIEEAGATIDLLAEADEAPFDGWLTPGPLPQLVRETRKAAGHPALLDKVTQPLARTRVALVMWKERQAALAKACEGGAVGWKCLGEAAGRPWQDVGGQPTWGTVKTALPDPAATATGLVALGAGTSSFFSQPDVGTLDIEENDAYGVWLSNLTRADVGADLGRMLVAGPSLVDVVAGLDVAIKPVVAGAAKSTEVTVIYPSPVATADVHLGTVASERATRLAEIVSGEVGREALRDAGWSSVGAEPSYLPPPGLLAALRSAWGNR